MKNLLLEVLDVYTCYVIIKVDKTYNRTDIFNQLRAIPGVIIVEPENNDFLKSRDTERYGYSLLKIKYISNGHAKTSIKQIRRLAISGSKYTRPIGGILKIIIKTSSINNI